MPRKNLLNLHAASGSQMTYASSGLKSNWPVCVTTKVEGVVQTIKATRARTTEAKQAKEKLVRYYLEHEDRMQYKTYLDQGLLIGSGPIEAAHRSVIQQRMKRSGQKWSEKGARAMADLRCYRASNAWGLVEKVIHAA